MNQSPQHKNNQCLPTNIYIMLNTYLYIGIPRMSFVIPNGSLSGKGEIPVNTRKSPYMPRSETVFNYLGKWENNGKKGIIFQ